MLQSIKIPELPSAVVLTEDDLIVVEQPDNTKKATIFQIVSKIEDSVEQTTLGILAQPDGSSNVVFQSQSVEEELKKIATTMSLGIPWAFPMGYDTSALGALFAFKGKDVAHFFRGSIHAGKTLYGIRNNACVTSFRAGNGSEDQGMWNSQITGVSNNLQLAQYGSPDKVGAYGDIAGTMEKAYQVTAAVISFTDNGFYTDNQNILDNIKVGMIVTTNESPRKWNIVKTIDKTTGLITGWDNWANLNGYATPANGAMVNVDPEGKIWTLNYNLIFPNGSRANQGVIAELGVLNQNGNSSNVNGIDIVNLPNSTSDCDTAILIRGGNSAGKKGWLTGASIRGYKNYGIWLTQTPEYTAVSDIYITTSSDHGVEFGGNHISYSMKFKLGGAGTYKDVYQTLYDPKGFLVRGGRNTAVITASTTLSPNVRAYRLNIGAASQTVTLPNTNGISAGHCQEILMYRNTPITIASNDGTTTVSIENGGAFASQTWTPTAGKRYLLDWDGSSWKIWG